jgi:PAS domain S-box-containing protein
MASMRQIISRFPANSRPWIKALSAGILCPAVALCVKIFLSSWMSTDRAPFLLFFGAVVGAGWIGGLWAGLLATALSAILADLMFFPPFGTLSVQSSSDWFNIITFILEATLISFLATFRDRVRKVAEAANERDQSLTTQLRSEQQIAATATRELESSLERLSILAATTADGIWDYDYDADRIWWSDRTFRLLGYEPGEMELTLERLDSMVHDEDRKSRQKAIAAHLAGETKHYFCELRLRHKDGSYRWFLSRGCALRDETGRGFRMIGTLTDVTELKTIETDLKAAKEQADIANRTKDEFLATLSHELRTPLNAILGWAQLIGMEQESLQNDRLREGVDVIERNVRSQLRLIEDLLDVSRIVTGKLRLEFRLVDFREVIPQAVEPLLPSAEAKDIRIEQFLDSGCGLVNGDRERLQQVIWNLLSNAIRFSYPHSKIQIALRQADSQVELAVTDSGKGIAPDLLPRLFDPFVQGETGTARSFAGLGLGLAIVRHLIELHGGKAEAYSDGVGRGATFKVSLPVAVQWPSTDPIPQFAGSFAPNTAIEDQKPLSGLKILVIEDVADTRSALGTFLRAAGASAVESATAEEALTILDRERFHVILSDIGLPNVDGYEFIRSLRSRPSDRGGQTPAAAITAYVRPEDRASVLLAGFQMHISKPINFPELAARMRTLAETSVDPTAETIRR